MTNNVELLLQIKWLTISISVCALIGAIFATGKVLLFEQTPSGRYAVHNECVQWNEACISGCQDAQYDNPQNPPSCEECCIQHKDVVTPLGKRITDSVKTYAVLVGSVGIVVGLTIADEKKKKYESNNLS